MCNNALIFNEPRSRIWKMAYKFQDQALSLIMKKWPNTEFGTYFSKIGTVFSRREAQSQTTSKQENALASQDKSYDVKTSKSLKTKLPASIVNMTLIALAPNQFYCAWQDCCIICGSHGDEDDFVFCMDCGEAFHTYCLDLPTVFSPKDSPVRREWRCPNCKVRFLFLFSLFFPLLSFFFPPLLSTFDLIYNIRNPYK